MSRRWVSGKLFRGLTNGNSSHKLGEFRRRDLLGLCTRSYSSVAASEEPNAIPNTAKPEVNLNKMFWSKPRSLALSSDSPHRFEEPQYDGIKRMILKLMLYYSKQSQFIRWANAVHRRVIFQVDNPAIYDVFSLEKTFKTTFSLLVLHMWLCLRRLKEEGREGVELGQYLYEIYNHDLELRVSKAGVNLLLTKWMKELEKIFYGNIVAYDEAIGKQDELQKVIWRNIFSEDGKSETGDHVLLPAQAMARYVRLQASSLSLTDKDAIFSGNFMFTLLEETNPAAAKK